MPLSISPRSHARTTRSCDSRTRLVLCSGPTAAALRQLTLRDVGSTGCRAGRYPWSTPSGCDATTSGWRCPYATVPASRRRAHRSAPPRRLGRQHEARDCRKDEDPDGTTPSSSALRRQDRVNRPFGENVLYTASLWRRISYWSARIGGAQRSWGRGVKPVKLAATVNGPKLAISRLITPLPCSRMPAVNSGLPLTRLKVTCNG